MKNILINCDACNSIKLYCYQTKSNQVFGYCFGCEQFYEIDDPKIFEQKDYSEPGSGIEDQLDEDKSEWMDIK